MISVAIDGPAGAGKSTLARRLAAELGYIYVDTGAMFRTIGLYALRAGKDPKDNEAVNALLPEISLRLDSVDGEQHIYLNGEDVSRLIRTDEVGMAASAVGANPAVRAFLLDQQRDMTRTQNVLMDGRDIGTAALLLQLGIGSGQQFFALLFCLGLRARYDLLTLALCGGQLPFIFRLHAVSRVLGGLGIGKLLLDERFAFFQDLIDPAEQKLAHEEIENQQIDDGKYEIDI